MKEDTMQRMDALLQGGAGRVLSAYLDELIQDEEKKFRQVNKETFEIHKGGVLALDKLLTKVNKGTVR